jgi:thiol-disulfide isomerase/thioredoxin
VNPGWYVYAPDGTNASLGKIETKVTYTPQEPVVKDGNPILPEASLKEGHQIFAGNGIVMEQRFVTPLSIKEGEYTIGYKILYQTCNGEICMPPVTETQVVKIWVSAKATQGLSNPLHGTLKTIDNEIIDLKSLQGKVVVIDCWATWCGPCVSEMPRLKEIYETYHSKGLEVIGISMDENDARDRVISLVQKKNLPWPQGFEGKGFEDNQFTVQYNITSLPAVFLVDRKGNIVDRNARGERLEPLIRKYLGVD